MTTIDELARTQGDQADFLAALSASLSRIEGELGIARRDELEARLTPGVPARLSAAGGSMVGAVGQAAPNATLGNATPFGSQGNLLNDPAFEGWPGGSNAIPLAPGSVALGAYWTASYVLDSGVGPTTLTAWGDERGSFDEQVGSALANVRSTWPASVGQVTVTLVSLLTFTFTDLPYLVAAIRPTAFLNSTGITGTVKIEIRDGGGALLATSAARDLDDFGAPTAPPISCAEGPNTGLNTLDREVRVIITLARTTAVGGAGLQGWFEFGDPQLHSAYSPDPIPYAPLLGRWYPSIVVAADGVTAPTVISARSAAGDTVDRFNLANDGEMEWGGGAATADTRLRRVGAGNLSMDANDAAITSRFIVESKIGQQAKLDVLVSGDATARAQLRGDATLVGLLLGGGGTQDVRFYRASSGRGIFDSNAQAFATNVDLEATAGQRNRLGLFVTGDSFHRAWLEGSGTISQLAFGPGSATQDVRLSRGAAGQLNIDSLSAAAQTYVQIRSTAAQRSLIGIGVAGDTADRLALYGDATVAGVLWGPGNAAADARAYRSGAKTLNLDDGAAGPLTALNFVGAVATIWGGDAQLSRSAANNLQLATGDTLDLNLGDLTLPVGTAAIPTTEGDVRWRTASNVTGGLLSLYDSQRERAISAVGWQPFALPIGAATTDALATALVLPINGGSVAIPFEIAGHMLLQNVTYRCTAASGTSEWRIYKQRLNNANAGENTLDEVPGANGTTAAQGAAANINSATATAPTYLAPGIYWIVIRCTSGATTFSLASTASGALPYGVCQTKTLGAGLGATLDFVAATWTKNSSTTGVRITARVFGQTTGF